MPRLQSIRVWIAIRFGSAALALGFRAQLRSQAELKVETVLAGARRGLGRHGGAAAACTLGFHHSAPGLHAFVLHALEVAEQQGGSAHMSPRAGWRLGHGQSTVVGFREVALHQDVAAAGAVMLLERGKGAGRRELGEEPSQRV